MENTNCDYGTDCINSEVRRLPTGGDTAVIVCRRHWLNEIEYRRERNKDLDANVQFDLPKWDTLEVYETAPR